MFKIYKDFLNSLQFYIFASQYTKKKALRNAEINSQQIKNILFDLGGVLLNINYQLTEEAFVNLGLKNFRAIYTQDRQQKLFHDFEKGNISSTEFLNMVQNIINNEVTHDDIINAWNAMLMDFPEHRYRMLKTLAPNYKLYLISNTNEIHINAFNKIFEDSFNHKFSSLFVKDYYSHIEGKRKPDAEIYEHIMLENGLIKEETLFIDDTAEHVKSASELGFHARLLQNEDVTMMLTSMGILT